MGWPPESPGVNAYVVYTYDWTGVPVATLLERAVLKEEAKDVIFWATDGYNSGLDLPYVLDPNIIIAIQANGGPLDRSTDEPFRLVVPGWWGYKWVKFVSKIEIVDYDYKGTWESGGYPDIAIIPPIQERTFDLSAMSLPLALIGLAAIASGFYLSSRR